MSSSNSNAAARRRRAGPSIPPPMTSMTSRVTQQRPPVQNIQQAQAQAHAQAQQAAQSSANSPNSSQGPRPVMTPAQMLIAHETRITELEKAIPEIMQNFVMAEEEEQISNTVTEKEPIVQQFTVNNEEQEAFNSQTNERFNVMEKTNVELTNKVSELEKELAAMQKSFNLLRDFATETNVLLMKVFNSESMVMSSGVDDETVSESTTKNEVTFDNINVVSDANNE